jgi:hypothetical protein
LALLQIGRLLVAFDEEDYFGLAFCILSIVTTLLVFVLYFVYKSKLAERARRNIEEAKAKIGVEDKLMFPTQT